MIFRSVPSDFVVVGLFVGLISIGVAGCSVGPNYHAPNTVVPDKFNALAQGVTTDERIPLELTRWWTVFQDEELNSLIDRAVRTNKDLKLADARIREARAQRSIARAGAFPTVNASAAYSRNRPRGGAPKELDIYQAGFDASWELDVFGGVRRSVEASTALEQATEETRRDILVILLSDIARNYIEVRSNQLRLVITRQNIEAQRQTYELTKARFEAGLGNELEVAQAEAQLSSTESQVPTLEAAIKQGAHRIGVLLGQEPATLLDELSAEAPIPIAPPEVPVGLPSDLLRRRPDVRQAERELAAATALIGVATADLFPRFSLTGILDWRSINAGDLITPQSRLWSIGPSVQWPVLDAGRIRANIRVQNAQQEQALAVYEQAVLTSLEDVENTLVAYSKELDRRKSLVSTVDSSRKAVDISNELYSKGLVDFLNVLLNQRALYQAQDALAVSDGLVSTNLVALFKALGGGWEVSPL